MDLTYEEAVQLARQKFPTFWRTDIFGAISEKPKQIVFVRELIDKIVSGNVKVTYRKAPKVGIYYVIQNRFKQKPESSRILIEFYQTDKIDPYKLNDEEAQLAGIESAEKIRELFENWYGSPLPQLYRNWFRIKEIGVA